jgi:hypothetical protein
MTLPRDCNNCVFHQQGVHPAQVKIPRPGCADGATCLECLEDGAHLPGFVAKKCSRDLYVHTAPRDSLYATPPADPVYPPMILSTVAEQRKRTPITTGVLDYFPRAVAAVAECSLAGNEQHHPGTPLHWDYKKSNDHADGIARHLIDRNSFDTDGVRHVVKLAWRALALLETTLREEEGV